MKIKILAGLLVSVLVLTGIVVYMNRESEPAFHETPENTAESSEAGDVSSEPSAENMLQELYRPVLEDLLAELETGVKGVEDESLLLLIDEENALGYYANLLMARRHENEDRNREAAGYYRTALGLYSSKEVNDSFASCFMVAGEEAEAERVYLSLLPDEAAMNALMQLETNPAKISEAFINQREWKAAEEFLKPMMESKSMEDMDDLLIRHYATALAEQGQLKAALPFYKKLYEIDNTDSAVAWWYGRSLESAGQTTEAMKIYSSIGEKGAYRRGVILRSTKGSLAAAEAYSKSSEAASLWKAARIWDEAGMYDKAIEAYAGAAESRNSYQDDAAYRAYILSNRLGRNDVEKFVQVLSEHPAWMSRLGKEPVMPDLKEVSYDQPDFLYRVEAYERDGYTEASAIELSIGTKSTDLETKLALGDWYEKRGEYYRSIVWGIQSLNEKPTRRGYELAYPLGFEELVREASDKYHVEPELVWAVIREESHFRYDAVSSAGAMGLMQVMPPTGKDIASRLGMKIENSDLLTPDISIEFGAFYIGSMLTMFDRDFDKAMAAYNGGPGNAQNWLESSFGTEKEDFPTAITFFETQEYITKVKNTYHIYQWLY